MFTPAMRGALPGGPFPAPGEFLIGSSRRGLHRAGMRFRTRPVDAAGRTVRFADGTCREVGVVVWATGYRPDSAWIDMPGVLRHRRVAYSRGVTGVPGLYFLGPLWQHIPGPELLCLVADDAVPVAAHAARTAATLLSGQVPGLRGAQTAPPHVGTDRRAPEGGRHARQ